VFTARYALSPYIKQTRFVFKGLNVRCARCFPRNRHRIIVHEYSLHISSYMKVSLDVFACILSYVLRNYTILIKCKKGKAFRAHGMKAYRENRSIAPLILNLSSRWRWMVNFTPCHFRRESWDPLNNRLGAPQRLYGPSGEDNILYCHRDMRPRPSSRLKKQEVLDMI
jgi:hypothetical protein